MDDQETTTTQTTVDESTTTTTTEAPTTTSTTTEAPTTTVDPNIQSQDGGDSQPMDAAVAAPAEPAQPATPAEPANSPTLNDVQQTQEERFAESRSLAMANHAAEQGQNPADQLAAEEEVA